MCVVYIPLMVLDEWSIFMNEKGEPKRVVDVKLVLQKPTRTWRDSCKVKTRLRLDIL